MDITPYHWYFALFFLIVFGIGMGWAYRNDLKKVSKTYGKIGIIAWVVFGGLLVLILVKFIARNL